MLASVSERLGQPVDAWQRLPGGEDCAAFGNGQSVLKLMPPPLADCAERDTELRDDCLALQTSRAPVPETEPWNSQHPGSFW